MPSLMTAKGMPLALAAEAQLCRATYRVNGIVTPTIPAIVLREVLKIKFLHNKGIMAKFA